MKHLVTGLLSLFVIASWATTSQPSSSDAESKLSSAKEATFDSNEEQLVHQFFGPDGIKNKEQVYIGEMLENYLDRPTLGESLPSGINVKTRELEASTKRMIYAVLLTKDGQSEDWYIYLINDKSKWKIASVRKLALPGFIFKILEELEGKPDRTIEEEHAYQNILLTIKLDSELKEFFQSNIQKLETISKEAINNPQNATKLAESLFLNFVKHNPDSGIVEVNIGGILDNSVGYLYIPETATVPVMSDDNYIYIEQLQGNWYLYKTT